MSTFKTSSKARSHKHSLSEDTKKEIKLAED